MSWECGFWPFLLKLGCGHSCVSTWVVITPSHSSQQHSMPQPFRSGKTKRKKVNKKTPKILDSPGSPWVTGDLRVSESWIFWCFWDFCEVHCKFLTWAVFSSHLHKIVSQISKPAQNLLICGPVVCTCRTGSASLRGDGDKRLHRTPALHCASQQSATSGTYDSWLASH